MFYIPDRIVMRIQAVCIVAALALMALGAVYHV